MTQRKTNSAGESAMWEYLMDDNLLAIVLVIFALAAVAGLTILFLTWRQGRQAQEETVVATSEWQPTAKIDFYCADLPKEAGAPASFLLRVEEFRTVESISGAEHTEIRWRKAMLSEAKSVLAMHRNATASREIPMPRLVRKPQPASQG